MFRNAKIGDKTMELDKIELEKIYSQGYGFYWKGKGQAVKDAENDGEGFIDFYDGNLYIEGDNLIALKRLQKEYKGKIKMIYIDPPYNTKKKFIYNDIFTKRKKESLSEGDRLHSNWLNMMYPRLSIARDLLTDDGAIFISIDENEQANLKLICDDIFGEGNLVADFIWNNKYTVSNDTDVSYQHENIYCYCKNRNDFILSLLPRTEKQNKDYKNRDNDPKGPWKPTPLHARSGNEKSLYEITFDNGITWKAPTGRYPRYSKENLQNFYKNNELYFNKNGGVDKKTYLSEVRDGVTCGTLWSYEDVGHSHGNNEEISEILGKGIFNDPKGIELLTRIINLSVKDKTSIILDFFSGSATTAHAVMQLNAEDGGNRKYIMVQLPEPCDEKSEAYKAGYKNICEIGKERIRRAGAKIKSDESLPLENREKLDTGFKAVKL